MTPNDFFVQNTHMFSMACEGTFRDRPFRRNTGIQRLQPIYSGNQYCGLDPTDHGSQTAKSGAKSRIAWKSCEYAAERNKYARDGLWKIGGSRQVVYAKKSLSAAERLTAIRRLTGD